MTDNIYAFSTDVRFPKAEGYGVLIDDIWWRILAGPQARVELGTRDSLAQRVDQFGSENFPVLDLGYTWARTYLSGGEGLDWSPREISLSENEVALDAIKFWDSYGINVIDSADSQYAISLVRKEKDWVNSITDPRDITVSKEHIYVADGDVVSWYTEWDDVVPVATDTLVSPVLALAASPNNTVVAVCEDGNAYAMRNYPTEIVFTIAYTAGPAPNLDAKGIWYANGRFLMSTFDDVDVSQLRSLDYSAGWSSTLIDTAAGPFWSVVESGPAIVAACSDGTLRTYTPTLDDPTLTLLPRARTDVPIGEEPILLGSNASILLVMTRSQNDDVDREAIRLYQAEVLDARFNYSIGQIQLRRDWMHAGVHDGDVTRNVVNTRDQMVFTVNEENVAGNVDDYSVWVFDLVTAGLHRAAWVEGVHLDALTVFGSEFGAIDDTGTKIIVADPEQLQEEGRMIFPNLTFGLNTDISWLATVVEASNLIDAGAQVELYYSTDPQAIHDFDDPSWTISQRITSQGGSNIERPLKGVKSRTLSLQLRMFSTQAGTSTPFVTRIAVRGIPAHRDFIVLVPINISDYISVPGRTPTHIPGYGYELQEILLDTVGNNVDMRVIDPPVLFRGILNNVSEPVEYISERGSVTRYVIAEFRGQRIVSGTIGQGNEALGIGLVGVSLVGVSDNLEIT